MFKKITFNNGVARLIRSGRKLFQVYIENSSRLPLNLVDKLDKRDCIEVREASMVCGDCYIWGEIITDIDDASLLEIVCEAIQDVYYSDVVISNK